jgi:2-polyprenyl-6-methoxyphenol hydroxylase-like FAD-dependent oxidoreductase
LEALTENRAHAIVIYHNCSAAGDYPAHAEISGEVELARPNRILIVGAGIGGLCTAVALAQIGAEVEVIDIKPDNAVAGVGWGLRTNGLRALREIGLLEPTLSIGFPTPPLSYFDRNGHHVVDIPYGRQFDGMPNNVQLPRLGFLEMASARALEAGCSIRMATTATDIQQDADGVTVELSDGSSDRYDLVIGFDGINSSIRRYLFGETYVPVRSGGVAWRAPVRAPDTLKGAIFCHGFGGKVGFVPLAGGMMYVIVTHYEPGRPRHDPAAFPDPYRADLSRTGAAHVSFGYGMRYCLGAALARMELKIVFSQLIPRFPTMQLLGEVSSMGEGFHSLSHGLSPLPVIW